MVRVPGLAAACGLALALALGAAPAQAQSPARGPAPLSEHDQSLYAAAFRAVRRGEFGEALARVASISDHSLMGQLQFEILFHRDYRASYEELSAWMERYADLPMAARVHALALRRRPAGAPEPRAPAVGAAAMAQAATAAPAPPPPTPRQAREALNAGELETAWTLALAADDPWVAGLAAFRLSRFDDAFGAFQRVALDPGEDVWVRAGAGYWTARSATAAGRPEQATEFLRLAARWPQTFYGQIAVRQLGLDLPLDGAGAAHQASVLLSQPESAVDQVALAVFLAQEPRARRAAALAQLGRPEDAGQELRAGLRAAVAEGERQNWLMLAQGLALGASGTGRVDALDYPTPQLAPDGGFSLERGLIYALVRKESLFDPSARSSVGAYGLMQVMPATAAELSGDPAFRSEPERLFDPGVNLRLGQNYLQYVLAMGPIQGDVLRAVAAYNGGPGPVFEAVRRLPPDADALLIIESIPSPQPRQYVEEVMAAYWIYQRLLGGRTATLDAVVAGASVVPLSLDAAPPEAVPTVIAAAP